MNIILIRSGTVTAMKIIGDDDDDDAWWWWWWWWWWYWWWCLLMNYFQRSWYWLTSGHPRATKPVLSWVKTNELRADGQPGSKDINGPRLQIHCTGRKQATMTSGKIAKARVIVVSTFVATLYSWHLMSFCRKQLDARRCEPCELKREALAMQWAF